MARQMKTMDGNTAAAHVSYAFTDVAAIYPITPSSNMADTTDQWSMQGRKNIFGHEVKVVEMQSEAGAAGAVHGSLQAGALTTTYTASQGLLLMIPNMYKIAGELLPSVIHVSARAIASHALSIFGDHSDIYAARQTGYAMLCSTNPQEVMDLAAVAHLATLDARVPFMHFFDGFRTSHEIQKVATWETEELEEMMNKEAVDAFRNKSLNPAHPVLRGSAQNDDIFFQWKEAANKFYLAVPEIVESYMDKVNKKIGTDYKLFNYYGAPDAEHVIVAMGSVNDAIEETIDYLVKQGKKVGLVKVRLYRPFAADRFVAALPATVKTVSVLDRTKEPGAQGEPLHLDVIAALKQMGKEDMPVYGGRYGLSSKDTKPVDIAAVYENAEKAQPKERFTISIVDDVTHLSLEPAADFDPIPEGTISAKFWGLGSDGTVGANKNSIKIIGDHTDMYAQAYFAYDSKKSGGVTTSHLRFGKSPIKSTYLVNKADFVACHNPSYITKYDIVSDIKPNGTFLLNCGWDEKELEAQLPGDVKAYIAKNNIKLYTIDGVEIAKEIGLGGRINTILQSAFFKLSNIIPAEDAVKYMKDAATKSYGRKGEQIVAMNHAAIDRGQQVTEINVPASWANENGAIVQPVAKGNRVDLVDFVNSVVTPVGAQAGYNLPVSAFAGREDGTMPQGTAAFEKRGIAIDVPVWQPDNCIQCNFCAYVCPHAVIRPMVMTEEEAANAPADMKFVDMTGLPGFKFAISVSVLDCTGCGSCAQVCPGKKGQKALVMQPLGEHREEQKNYDYAFNLPVKEEVFEKFKPNTVKGSQFKQPLLEFNGACAGCGETPYARLVTQLYGDRMYIANATGCSSIWGGSAPSSPYTVNKKGFGPAWGNSLFEDNAEFGYGMYLAQKTLRERLIEKVQWLSENSTNPAKKEAAAEFMETVNDGALNQIASDKLLAICETDAECGICQELLKNRDYLVKKSVWIFGGDGWAYDIGFGGLDHVIASGEDVNILVFDTEVYSNTGGQSSKSTPVGATAQFAASGKGIRKKDLGAIAMSYGYVYVAQIAMGADYNQTMKAMLEAESYNGPSVIIAYSPCIEQGIKGGLTYAQAETKRAVECGYWHMYRFDPRREELGQNPFQLDSKAPKADFKEFLMGEVRYSALAKTDPERAEMLFDSAAQDAEKRYKHLVRLSKLYEVE